MKKHITAVAALAGSLLFAPVLMNQANAGQGMGRPWAAAWATWAEAYMGEDPHGRRHGPHGRRHGPHGRRPHLPAGTWAAVTSAEAE